MQRFSLSPRAYRRVTAGALAALAFIVVTGAAVRLTGSGLGCPDWPTCAEGRFVAPLEYHALVEFVNRTVTGLVSLAVMLAVLGSLVRRPRRRDLTWLSLGLVAGVLAQIVLGGLVVLFHLYPPLVMGHFVVSMVLLWNATVLHHRAGLADDPTPTAAPVDAGTAALGRLVVVATGVAVFLGTVVTGSGPHAGSHDGELVERLPFDVGDVARLHGLSVVVLVALVVLTLRSLSVAAAPADLQRRGRVVLGVLLVQAGIGYVQYFTGVPAVLVGLHVAGAVAVWIAVLRLRLAMGRTATASLPTADAALAPVP